MKTYTLEELQDKHLGPVGTESRDQFEYELQMDLIGNAIKQNGDLKGPDISELD